MYALALDLQVGGWKKQLEWVEAAQGIFSRVGVYCDKDIIHVDMMSDRCPYVRKNGHDTCTYDLESQKSTAQQQCG
jgi:hypothetical protein